MFSFSHRELQIIGTYPSRADIWSFSWLQFANAEIATRSGRLIFSAQTPSISRNLDLSESPHLHLHPWTSSLIASYKSSTSQAQETDLAPSPAIIIRTHLH